MYKTLKLMNFHFKKRICHVSKYYFSYSILDIRFYSKKIYILKIHPERTCRTRAYYETGLISDCQ